MMTDRLEESCAAAVTYSKESDLIIEFHETFNYDLTWAPVEGYKNTYTISTTENGVPMGEYIISEDGMTLKGPITLTKVVEE